MNLERFFSRPILILMPALMTVILLAVISCSSGQPNPPAASIFQISPVPPASVSQPAPPPSTGTPPGIHPPLTPSSPAQLVQKVQNIPTPVYSPEPEIFAPYSDVIATGTVLDSQPQFQDGHDTYRDWTVKVENFIVNPLPQASLKVRIWEQAGTMPVKGVHLSQGEHLLMFLMAEGDHFIFAGGLWGAKYTIDGDNINYSIMGGSAKESLSAAIPRIKTVAETWKNEKLTVERKSQIATIATGNPGIKDFLTGKEFEIGEVIPVVKKDALTEISYAVSIYTPKQSHSDVQLVATVNCTRNKVDRIQVNAYTANSEITKNQIQGVALADAAVKGLIGDRGYTVSNITTDSWQEDINGKTVINVFPKIDISLEPAVSNILHVFVDLNAQKVVKIINESYLSPSPLESNGSLEDFKLAISISKAVYQVGEVAEALLTLSYSGTQPVKLSSLNGKYFDLLIRDDHNNIIYQWERWTAGLPPSLPAQTPTSLPPPMNAVPSYPVKETINPGQTITARLQFSIPKAGTYYLIGRNYGGWDFGEVLANYPNGTGYGLHIEAPFITVEVH